MRVWRMKRCGYVCFLFLFCYFLLSIVSHDSNKKDVSSTLHATNDSCIVVDVATIIGGPSTAVKQFSQLLLKSLLHSRLSTTWLNFHIVVVDSPEYDTFNIVKTVLASWGLGGVSIYLYRMEDHVVSNSLNWLGNYETGHYSKKYGLLKLMISDILPLSLDQVIYIDIDVVVLRDLRHLLKERQHKSSDSSCWFYFTENLSQWYEMSENGVWPAIGRGYNTGVGIIDLAKLRKHHWSEIWPIVYQKVVTRLNTFPSLADQDVINAVIAESDVHHDIVCRIDCSWNLQFGELSDVSLCQKTLHHPPATLHFNRPKTASFLIDAAGDHFDSFLAARLVSTVTRDSTLIYRHFFSECSTFDEINTRSTYDKETERTDVDRSSLRLTDNSISTYRYSQPFSVSKDEQLFSRKCSSFVNRAAFRYRIFPSYFHFLPEQISQEDRRFIVFTHLSFDRGLNSTLRPFCEHHFNVMPKTPLSIAVFIREADVMMLEAFFASDSCPCVSPDARTIVNVVFEPDSGLADLFRNQGQQQTTRYPINLLRNLGLSDAVRLKFIWHLMLDVDFFVSSSMSSIILPQVMTSDSGVSHCFVLPALEVTTSDTVSPKLKDDFMRTILSNITALRSSLSTPNKDISVGSFREKVWPSGHGATNVQHWMAAKAQYEVEWRQNYEPYLICPTSNDDHDHIMPIRYDERLVGFGWNKSSFTTFLYALGYHFIVLNEAYVVHALEHVASMDLSGWRRKTAMLNDEDSDGEKMASTYEMCQKLLKSIIQNDLVAVYEKTSGWLNSTDAQRQKKRFNLLANI